MNKKLGILIGIIVAATLVGGVLLALRDADTVANESTSSSDQTSPTEIVTDASSADTPATTEPATSGANTPTSPSTPSVPASKPGVYVTLETYSANKQQYTGLKQVYFFHAPWCPICQGIDKEVSASTSKLPANSVLIKTDFDSSTDLRKKYGVTQQYTFVQVNDSGAQIKKWSATSLDKVVSQIQ